MISSIRMRKPKELAMPRRTEDFLDEIFEKLEKGVKANFIGNFYTVCKNVHILNENFYSFRCPDC